VKTVYERLKVLDQNLADEFSPQFGTTIKHLISGQCRQRPIFFHCDAKTAYELEGFVDKPPAAGSYGRFPISRSKIVFGEVPRANQSCG